MTRSHTSRKTSGAPPADVEDYLPTAVPSPPEFFLDRSIGGRDIADALRNSGSIIRTHLEVQGARDQNVRHVEWPELRARDGDELEVHNRRRRLRLLTELGWAPG